jgi:uncharacterized repeat protein (TIGR01451 family)
MNNLPRVVVVAVLFLVAVTAVPLFTQSAFAQSTDVAITIEASIDQQAPADRIAVGQSVDYLIEWAGTPPLQTENLVFEVDVPGVVTNIDEGRQVACTSGDPVRCTFRDPREFDGHVWVRVRVDTPGVHTTTARIVHLDGTPDTNPSNDVATHTLEALALPSVAVIASTGGPIEPGDSLAFSVTLRNQGATPATNVAFALTLPAGGTVVTGTPRIGVADCAIQNNTLVCTKASLLQGDIVQIDVTVTAPLRIDGEDLVIEIVETQVEQDVDASDNRRTLRAVMVRHFIVANTGDEGAGSLRQAIHDVNAHCPITRPCALLFQISEPVPATGWFTIQPRTPLPEIVASLRIDGLAQTSYSGDTNPEGPEIEINGELVSERSGLVVRPNCRLEISGLAVNGFPGYAIEVRRGDVSCSTNFPEAVIRENYLGTDPRGRTAKPNQRGLGIFTFESHVFSNLISGNQRSGIYVEDGAFHAISGNRIGVGADGSPLGNGAGIFVNMGNQFESFIGADITNNVIAYNRGMAVARTRQGEILISRNSIFDNLQRGIDVGIDGFTPQRADDRDVPNAPVLFGATYDAARHATIVRGRIDSEAHADGGPTGASGRNIEIYASLRLSGWAEPQAERSMAISPIPSGHQDFEVVVPGDLRGMWITATHNATHFLGLARRNPAGPSSETHRELFPGDTSELSNAVSVH